MYGPHHSFAVFTDGCSNESVLDKVVCESFTKKRVSAQKVGQHLIITYHTITEEGGGRGRGEVRRGGERRGEERRGKEGRGEERRGERERETKEREREREELNMH